MGGAAPPVTPAAPTAKGGDLPRKQHAATARGSAAPAAATAEDSTATTAGTAPAAAGVCHRRPLLPQKHYRRGSRHRSRNGLCRGSSRRCPLHRRRSNRRPCSRGSSTRCHSHHRRYTSSSRVSCGSRSCGNSRRRRHLCRFSSSRLPCSSAEEMPIVAAAGDATAPATVNDGSHPPTPGVPPRTILRQQQETPALPQPQQQGTSPQ